MNSVKILAVAVLLALAQVAIAQPYVALGAARTSTSSSFAGDHDGTGFGLDLALGYRISPAFSVEGSWFKPDQVATDITKTSSKKEDVTTSSQQSASGPKLSLIGRLPVASKLWVTGSVSAYFLDGKANAVTTTVRKVYQPGMASTSSTTSGTDTALGLGFGAEYLIQKQLLARAKIEMLRTDESLYGDSGGARDITSFGLQIVKEF